MNEPEALSIANHLETKHLNFRHIVAAAAELRRLNGVNAELLAALQTVLSESYDGPLHDDYRRQARAAIAKAEGDTP